MINGTLHTVEIELSSGDALRLLDEANSRPDLITLTCGGDISSREIQVMTLTVDGSETATEICLHHDGTWTASTHISLGLKAN